MYDLKHAWFLDGAVRRSAVGAVDSLARERIDGLDEDLALDVLEVWPSEALEVSAPVGFLEENARASLKVAKSDC